MGKRNPTIIDRFDGGMATDPRTKDTRKSRMIEHFDVHRFPHKLYPLLDSTADEQSKTPLIKRFCIGRRTNSDTPVIWGLGASSGDSAIYFHDIDPTSSGWTTPANNKAAGNVDYSWVFQYKSYVYFMQSNGNLAAYDTNAATISSNYQTLGSTSYKAKPLVHPADDIAYFFEDNKVHSLNDDDAGSRTWSGAVLTLPLETRIVDACAYGNYLALAVVPKGNKYYGEPCYVYLWDRDSSLTTLSHKINFGHGFLRHIAVLDGLLIGVTDEFINTPGISANTVQMANLVVRAATTGTDNARIINKIPSDGLTNSITNFVDSNFVADNILYFPARLTIDGVERVGIWSTDSQGRVTLERKEEDVNAASGLISEIIKVGNFWFIAHSNDGSVNKTNTSDSRTFTSIYESLTFTGNDPSATKKLIGATVSYEALGASGQVVLKAKFDDDSSWTTLFTDTTTGSKRTSVNKDATGANFPECKDLRFRIESSGGAVITSLKFLTEDIVDDIYNV